MIWPFLNKQKPTAPALVFKSGEAFLQHFCKYGKTDIIPRRGLPALVLEVRIGSGMQGAVKIGADGRQLALLRIVSEDGGFKHIAYTPSRRGDRLKPGDLVMWVPHEYRSDLAEAAEDQRFGWIGFVRAKLAPEIGWAGELTILCRYD